jgi:hypothetical protein
MNYIKTFEAELAAKLASGTEDTRHIVRFASEKLLESYKNGLATGRKRAAAKESAPKAE